MELKKLTIDSLDIPVLEEINEEAIHDKLMKGEAYESDQLFR